MHTGLKEVLEFWEDLIYVRCHLYFQTGVLLNGILMESAEFFKFNVIQFLKS